MSATIGRILLMPKGTYNGSTVYNSLDWVRYNGSAWVCKVDGTVGVVPVEGANWTVLAQDGNVSGNVDWSNINYKPFDDLAVGGGLEVDGSNKLLLAPNYLVGSNIGYDNTASGLTASDVQDAIDELAGMTVDLSTDLLAGSNITLTTKPDGKVEIASTGGGGGGSSTLAGLNDVNISSAQNDQILKYDSASSKWVNGSGGGHQMIPSPDASVTESSIVTAITGALTEGGTNDDVISGFGVGKWSNTDTNIILSEVNQGDTEMGTWEDDSTWETGSRVGWLYHRALFKVLDTTNGVHIEPSFELQEHQNSGIGYVAYRIDDEIYQSTTPTSNPKAEGLYELSGTTYVLTNDETIVSGKTYYVGLGAGAIKFNAPIPTTDVQVGFVLTKLRTNVFRGITRSTS